MLQSPTADREFHRYRGFLPRMETRQGYIKKNGGTIPEFASLPHNCQSCSFRFSGNLLALKLRPEMTLGATKLAPGVPTTPAVEGQPPILLTNIQTSSSCCFKSLTSYYLSPMASVCLLCKARSQYSRKSQDRRKNLSCSQHYSGGSAPKARISRMYHKDASVTLLLTFLLHRKAHNHVALG